MDGLLYYRHHTRVHSTMRGFATGTAICILDLDAPDAQLRHSQVRGVLQVHIESMCGATIRTATEDVLSTKKLDVKC